jgi:hypothetical protein
MVAVAVAVGMLLHVTRKKLALAENNTEPITKQNARWADRQ